ncbi:MAG TPA: hypothetical protein VHN82_01805 [Methanoregula sp.]|nr:hypothetical protein [Methanoregula sp.]
MNSETKGILRGLASLAGDSHIGDYLSSPDFARFCRDYDICDEWDKYLVLSRDNPALYGDSVLVHAFVLFLEHLHHHMPERFLFLTSRLLFDFSRGLSCDLPVDEIRSSFLRLGYPPEKVDPALFALRIKQVPDTEATEA